MGCDDARRAGSVAVGDDPPGDVSGARSDVQDTRVDEVLAASYRTVFDALDEAFCVVEVIVDDGGRAVDYRFVEVNAAFEGHTGLGEVIGRSVHDVLPEIEPSWIETYGEVARTGEPIRFVDEVASMRRWFDVYAWPLGRPGTQRVALHFTDITERKRAEDELRYRSEQFHALVEQAPIGVYLLDADFCILEANPAARRVFGRVDDLVGRDYEETLQRVWPNAIADEVVRIARHTLRTGIPHHDPEMAVVRADRGSMEYYDWRMDRIRLADGGNGIVCYFRDVSTEVWARHALSVSEHRYRTLFESIDEGFCIVHVLFDDERPIDYRFVEVNPAFERHTGIEKAAGRTITELVPEIEDFWIDVFGTVALTGEPTRFVDHAASMGRWFDDYAFRIGEPHEHLVAVLFNDVTDRKATEHALEESVALLRHHASHDALTGLPNRVVFEDRLGLAIADAERNGRAFALLFLDLDDFKAINDDLGHASGDAVLVEVARRLRSSLRASDTLARIHGDEFVAILPELSEAHEFGILEDKLRTAVGRPIDVAGTTVRVQVSIGASRYPTDGTSPRTLLGAADAAMYRAKQGGCLESG